MGILNNIALTNNARDGILPIFLENSDPNIQRRLDMEIQKFTISNDPVFYEAWPDVVLTASGKLVAVFSECTHHHNRDYTRIMLADSFDRGRTWTPKRPLTEGTRGLDYYYNCARISQLKDGRLVVIVDRLPADGRHEDDRTGVSSNLLYFSHDDGATWEPPVETPLRGIVPDKLLELETGRWLIAAHRKEEGRLAMFLHWSDDMGKTWSPAVTVAKSPDFNLCEISLLPMGGGIIAGFMRENSCKGYDCKKVLSFDGGESWGKVVDFPLPACHRPVAGHLRDSSVFITFRFMPGGAGWFGSWAHNFFAALTDRKSVLAQNRGEAGTRIMPVDYDRALKADLGYSGWVQFDDGEIYIVNYIVDDAVDTGQIRGYSLHPEDFFLRREPS